MTETPRRPFEGIRVVEAATLFAAPLTEVVDVNVARAGGADERGLPEVLHDLCPR
ncbi:MAG: hypothetical protein ABIR67_02070 [Gaiellaceae bacterium]